MVMFKLLIAATVAGLVTAWPEPTAAAYLDNRAIDCSKVTGCLSVLKRIGPPATTFCSSYLKIPATKTSTTTFTPTAVTITTSTTTMTVTSAACGPQKRNAPIDNRGFEYARAADVEDTKRADLLGLLAPFAAAKISEGCSCLNVQPKATKIATFTAATPTVNVVATSTQCVVAPPVCVPDGGPCDLFNPGACCGQACRNIGDPNNPDGECFSFRK